MKLKKKNNNNKYSPNTMYEHDFGVIDNNNYTRSILESVVVSELFDVLSAGRNFARNT